MGNKGILINAVISLLVGGVVYLAAVMGSAPTTNYINIGEFINEFKMAQELNQEYEKVANARKTVLDSMQLELDRMLNAFESGNEAQESTILKKREIYFSRKQQFEAQNAELNAKYNAQILKRMNEYIQSFGKEHNCDLILGAKGEGNVLFAKEGLDRTQAIITYANEKYNGQ